MRSMRGGTAMTAGRKEPVIPTPAPAPMPASPRPTVAARMNRLPITSWHRRATIAIGLGLFFDIYEVFLSGVLVSVLGHQFHLDSTGVSLLLASAFLGMFLGALTLGRLADRLGRRPAFLLALSIYSMFSLVGAFSVGPVMLVVSRFFAGLGIGAEPPISDTYLADLLPPKQRGKYMAWAYTLSFAGVPLAGFLAHWLVPIAPLGFDGWRWMFVVGALGAVIVFALRTGLPESPRWLESVGRTRDAEVVVARFEEQARAAGDPLPEPARGAPAAPARQRARTVRPAVPSPHPDDGGFPPVPDVGLLRIWHAGADSPGGKGIFDRGLAAVQRRDVSGLPARVGVIGAPGRALRAQVLGNRRGAGNGGVRAGLRVGDVHPGDRGLRLSLHDRQQRVLERVPHLSGGGVPDAAARHRDQQYVFALAAVQWADALHIAALVAQRRRGHVVRGRCGGAGGGRARHCTVRSAHHRSCARERKRDTARGR